MLLWTSHASNTAASGFILSAIRAGSTMKLQNGSAAILLTICSLSDLQEDFLKKRSVPVTPSLYIEYSMARAGTPKDSAVMGSLFGRFKDVLQFHFRYWEFDNLSFVTEKAIRYFNCERPLRKLT